MRTATLILSLSVTFLQTVAWADCCCVLICRHRGESCSDCDHTQPPAPRPPPDDCWKGKAENPRPSDERPEGKKCTHLEPSSEVLVQDAGVPAAPEAAAIILADPTPAAPPAGRYRGDPQASIARGSPPLYLLNSVLLI